MDELKKIFKAYTAATKEINEKDKTVEVVVSTGAVDRDKEIVDPEAMRKGLKEYKKRPILLVNHSWNSVRAQIGEAVNIKVDQDGNTVAKFKYYTQEGNPEADWAYVLASKGIAAYSIGFLVKSTEDLDPQKTGALRKITDLELVEISQVTVPSNREAIQARRDAENVDSLEKELCELALKGLDDAHYARYGETEAKEEEISDLYLIKKTITQAVKEIERQDTIEAVQKVIADMNLKQLMKDAFKELKEELMYAGLMNVGKVEQKSAPELSGDKQEPSHTDVIRAIKEQLTLKGK